MAHVYVPTVWVNGQTQLNAANMNKIEEELARLARESGGITEVLEGPGITVTGNDRSVIVGLKAGTSEDNLLVLDSDNGLILTLSMGYDPETRELVLSSGSGWQTSVQFDIDKVIVDGYYDPETRNIVLTLSDDTEIIVDMSNLKINWKMINSRSIQVVESVDEDGIQTFKFHARISKKERNEITILEDGLYSERMDWNNLGISDEEDGRWEFEGEVGNEYWYFESSHSVRIDEYTDSDGVDYYNFNYRISTDDGNILEIRNGKLYVPDEIPEDAIARQELERLQEEYNTLRAVIYKTSSSIKLTHVVDPDTGGMYVYGDVRLSSDLGNEIEIRDDGVYVPPYEPDPDMPSLDPYIERLEELEKEYPRVHQELHYFAESVDI